MIPAIAIAIGLSFLLGVEYSDQMRRRESRRRRIALEERFRRDAEAYRFNSLHPAPTLAELRSRGITPEDVQRAMEDLK